MVDKYFPKEFEKKWSEKWEEDRVYKTPNVVDKKNKKYVLVMFPYPSGSGLHVGHVRVYTGTDVLARYYRMNKKSVLHPMGWDAFGLPAENAAIKEKKIPQDIVPRNIATFKKQMQMMGLSYDWDRELNTTDSNYYKWTQWLFIQFYKMELLYKKDTPINFCPFCKTGLSEEEVLPNGTHERCNTKIEKRDLPQWIFKITDYADRLLLDLKGLDWPRGILEMQKNWIGKKEGINISYKVKNSDEIVTCFTTRPDTNFGATFIVLAPEHPFIKRVQSAKVKQYVEATASKSEMERSSEGRKKTGVFTGYYAINNLNGREMPIYVSDFVLMGFGTGAVVGVPGHDIRDFEFAKEFNLDIVRVVVGKDGNRSPITKVEQVQEEEGMMINSEFLNDLDIHEATQKIMDWFEEKKLGKRVNSYHLRDWIFSRQRYWGEPIPMVYCEEDKWVPVAESDLPVKLPEVKSYEPSGTGESPLAKIKDWVDTKCPKCDGPAKRETDTMPNWAGSCWYFLRFADPKNEKEPWNKKSLTDWQPVDWYIGGAEHAVLHLLYSRFWIKALQDLKLVDFSEPFLRLRNVGMVIAEDSRKMSKSFGNVINPDDVVAEFGADTLRIYEMFMAPFDQQVAWSTNALQGSYRFLKRVWHIYQNYKESTDIRLVKKLNQTIAKITRDLTQMKFNTSVAALMEFLNELEKNPAMPKEHAKQFLQLLAPFAPFMTEEIWQTVFAEKTSIHLSAWPKVEGKIVEDEVTIPVQINGKVRAVLKIKSTYISKDTVVQKALEDVKVKSYVEGKKYKVIYIEGKILNLVVSS